MSGPPGQGAFFIEAFLHRQYFGDLPYWNLPAFREGNPVALEKRPAGQGLAVVQRRSARGGAGRDQVHFGPLRSALLPSSRLPFLDMLRLTLPVGRLTMDLMISSLQNRRGDRRPGPFGQPDIQFRTNIIFANLHRFEYDFGRLRAAVTGLGHLRAEEQRLRAGRLLPGLQLARHAVPAFQPEPGLRPGRRPVPRFPGDDAVRPGRRQRF